MFKKLNILANHVCKQSQYANRKVASPLVPAALSFPVNLSRAKKKTFPNSHFGVCKIDFVFGLRDGRRWRCGATGASSAPSSFFFIYFETSSSPVRLGDGGRVAPALGASGLVSPPGHAGPSRCLLVSKNNKKQIYSGHSLGDFHSAKTPCFPPPSCASSLN